MTINLATADTRFAAADREWFIAIAGNIGAGKSSLTRLLADHFSWKPFYEANSENPYLTDFYQDMTQWSFHSQVFFLGKRLEHHRQLIDHPGSVVQDRTVYEDAEIFACNLYKQGHMRQRDYDTYRSLYEAVRAFLPPPNLIIYLQASQEKLVSHIKKRGREFEQDIDPAYIGGLNELYDNWISDWTMCPVLTVHMDEVDFIQSADDLNQIYTQVAETLSEL